MKSVVYQFVAKTLRPSLLILPVRDATIATSDVGVMARIHVAGT